MRLNYRTVWISDVHLGSRGCQARDLIRFLRAVDCEYLYLVGDIIDFWRLKGRSYWPAEHHEVVQNILKLVRKGTRVIYVPGNHDEVARDYCGLEFGGVTVLQQHIHETSDGRSLLVTHGDQFDLVIKNSPLLSLSGAAAYEWLIRINRIYNKWRRWRGLPYWSLSRYLKLKVKSACTYVSRFEETLIRDAQRRGMDGVVCGHIHKAEVVEDDVSYYNCGDWVESCTAVVEDADGRIRVVEALAEIARLAREGRAPTPEPAGLAD